MYYGFLIKVRCPWLYKQNILLSFSSSTSIEKIRFHYLRDITRLKFLLPRISAILIFHRTEKHKHQAQHGATIIIIIRQSLSSLLPSLLLLLSHIIIPRHHATMTANFVEIWNALKPTWKNKTFIIIRKCDISKCGPQLI